MDFREQSYLAGHPDFVARVAVAIAKSAVAIGNETLDPADAFAVLRHALATKVLNDPVTWQAPWARAVTSNAAIEFGSLDSDIEYTVNSMWSAMAGASTPPGP
jgi:hypothetical protein